MRKTAVNFDASGDRTEVKKKDEPTRIESETVVARWERTLENISQPMRGNLAEH